MNANDIRRIYLEFFERKAHKIVPSSPIVNKNDPTLMFANSGMAQFKDYFLGNREAPYKRIADTQKCLRVSGKHNDLEDVGLDGYHHTMFEMLGNWSFGDYFKEEAIEWAWELLTEVYKLPKNQLYVTVFEGDEKDGTQRDDEARAFWLKWVPASQILYGNKKDNFWEMGDQGPCGPCSEIHFDMRPKHERDTLDGATLVNKDNPQVVEIWNLVFMQFERKADGSLIELPAKHVDTGMGFERLVRGIQGKTSNYDTDIFTPFIQHIEHVSGIPYKGSFDSQAKSDIAMRVISDHIRAVSFCIADGQLPSNNGAGYVIRRILRRAIRYYFSFLGIRQPLLYQLVPILAEQMKDIFGELNAQKDFIAKVIMAEEETFLKTLEVGLRRLDAVKVHNNLLDGKVIFELYDTFGFPFDLTRLIAIEKGYELDENGFNQALLVQKERSRAAADKDVSDWTVINDLESAFVGYDTLHTTTQIVKYRTVKTPKGTEYHLVLHETPFYPEGGGQIGDTGTLQIGSQTLQVLDTKKENDLIIHYLSALPTDFESPVAAQVTAAKRRLTENNHSATHLMHAALRQVLGIHVQQKGSLVNDEYLRFDFSHFQKVTPTKFNKLSKSSTKKYAKT
jgi:alanyl-tRNA synthetase